MIMLTHLTREKRINAAIARIEALPRASQEGDPHPAWKKLSDIIALPELIPA